MVWVGGGETPIRGNVSHGDGVWKSTDAGKTWQYMGLKETQYIARVLIHPGNPDIVYVGALGHVFGPNKDRGVFRTTDGGRQWTRTLAIDGTETYDVEGALTPRATLMLVITRTSGEVVKVPMTCRLDTAEEVSVYEAGGVLQRFAQDFLAQNQAA